MNIERTFHRAGCQIPFAIGQCITTKPAGGMTGDCVTPWREIARFEDKEDTVRAHEYRRKTSASTTPALTQEETLCVMQTEALCVQKSKKIPCARQTNRDEQQSLSKKTACILRHKLHLWCMFLATHLAMPNVVKRSLSQQVAQRIDENHRQREVREKLGPSDRERKPCALLGRPFQHSTSPAFCKSEPKQRHAKRFRTRRSTSL